jgi:hypothetical protein
MDKVQKPSNPECYTSSSEPFRIYKCVPFDSNSRSVIILKWVLEKSFFGNVSMVEPSHSNMTRSQFRRWPLSAIVGYTSSLKHLQPHGHGNNSIHVATVAVAPVRVLSLFECVVHFEVNDMFIVILQKKVVLTVRYFGSSLILVNMILKDLRN